MPSGEFINAKLGLFTKSVDTFESKRAKMPFFGGRGGTSKIFNFMKWPNLVLIDSREFAKGRYFKDFNFSLWLKIGPNNSPGPSD